MFSCVKNNELTAILNTYFRGKINLANVRLMARFICALCKVRTVSFEKLANAFGTAARSGSSLGRIQVKKHDRKAKSIFRYGLDYLSNCLLRAIRPMEIDINKFLSCIWI